MISIAHNVHEQMRSQRSRVGSKKFVQQGRSQFCARSVLVIREYGKMARTRAVAIAALARRRPLATFFNRPTY